MRDRIREWTDGAEEFEHRARPTVRDEDRQRVLFLGLDLNEVNVHAVDVRHELRQRIQLRLRLAPVVARAPVLHQGLQPGQLRTLRLIGDGFLIGPARGSNAPAEINERGFGHVDAEGTDGVCCALPRVELGDGGRHSGLLRTGLGVAGSGEQEEAAGYGGCHGGGNAAPDGQW